MSAAALELQDHDEPLAASPALLRQQAAEVLAAHRSRRQRAAAERGQGVLSPEMVSDAVRPSRSQRIASRVTERYAQSQSYRAFLAAEAGEATHKAQAAAEVAARTAHAVAEVQQKLLQELDEADVYFTSSSDDLDHRQTTYLVEEPSQQTETRIPASFEAPPSLIAQASRSGLTVRLFEDAGSVVRPPAASIAHHSTESFEIANPEEAEALDDEISFRQAPTFDVEHSSVPIPGNLLEFPRQLVAARKARPRYAEGPLREDGHKAHDEAQLRIFEVDATQMTTAPPVESSTPEWSSIWLDALATDAPEEMIEPAAKAAIPMIEAASIERRIMASIVDTCLVGIGFVAFAFVFAWNAPVLPSPVPAAVATVVVFAAMFVVYYALFFTLSDATAGMRFARIGLCTFADENPTRLALLGRLPATLLAAFPLGLGLLWACLDGDRLGWHDRLSGMYQRSY